MRKKGHERKRQRRTSGSDQPDPGLLASYLSDPIALWQNGDYWALDALYAECDDIHANANPERDQFESGAPEDDELPF